MFRGKVAGYCVRPVEDTSRTSMWRPGNAKAPANRVLPANDTDMRVEML